MLIALLLGYVIVAEPMSRKSSVVWTLVLLVLLADIFNYLQNLFPNLETTAKGETDRLSAAELRATITIPALQEAVRKMGSLPEETIPLWLEESQLDKMDVENQDVVRIKTKWDCPFVCELVS